MTVPQANPISNKWKEWLDLSWREAPELFEDAHDVRQTPHAGAIRTTLTELGASAVFCVQGVPTVVILVVEEYERERIVRLHAALWNQGLASLLLVLSGDTIRAFSLARVPQSGDNDDFDHRCLIPELSALADGLAVKDIIFGAESGRIWEQHSEYFQSTDRIDQVLLDNLTLSHEWLCKEGLSSDAAQALLIQTMFIAYLEDRDIAGREYFLTASHGRADSFSALLQLQRVGFMDRLFGHLRQDFNGDLFVAPCSFDTKSGNPSLNRAHMAILARFRDGREEMDRRGSQFRFWGYDFKYIPVELISAVYDRFLGEKEDERRQLGAYYTPMFLADTVISQVWDVLSAETKDKGVFLDPACGSGVFLVRSFQRLCEHWKETKKSRTIRWASLLAILSRLHGWDINSGAVRVAVFSLYIALLEEVSPPNVKLLIKRGRLLPKLWGRTLYSRDFFEVPLDEMNADVVIGNPPWSSRRGRDRPSAKWCISAERPMPGGEDAWAFVWKSLQHLAEHGVVAFVLPAMGFLHNHAANALSARNRFMREACIYRIVNFADMRFQLFDGAVRPAALIIFGPHVEGKLDYRFDYWVPKADLNLRIKRVITLSSADKRVMTSRMVSDDPLVFKRSLWMSDPEAKLFNFLTRFPALGNLVSEYGSLSRRRLSFDERWVVGQGFKPARADRSNDDDYSAEYSDIVANTPFLPIGAFRPLAQDSNGLRAWQGGSVHRRGFERGFFGSRVLVPRGVSIGQQRLRAAFVQEALTFQHIIQAIAVPTGDEEHAKLLTALLNSKLLLWFAFHGTSSFGSDRPEVQQAQLLRLPFPLPKDLPEPEEAKSISRALAALVDGAVESQKKAFLLRSGDTGLFDEVDRLTYLYFGLSDEEVALVEDVVANIIPAVQPSRTGFPDIWKPAGRGDRETYASTLVKCMDRWFEGDGSVGISLVARNSDLAVVRLSLEEGGRISEYREEEVKSVSEVLIELYANIHRPLPGNFQLMPDCRLFIDRYLYLVKPTQRRFWSRTAALADADAIALDLHDAIRLNEGRSGE